MNIWIIVIAVAIFIALGRQFYMNTDSIFFRIRVFVTEVIVTSIVIRILVFITKWVIGLF
jgi:hypothetical protein